MAGFPIIYSRRGAGKMDTVNMLWIGPNLRRLERECMQSFLTVGHPLRLFCYHEPEGVPAGVEVQDAAAILPEDQIFTYQVGTGKGSVAAFANLFRYKLLHTCGGWWSDADVYCLRPWSFPSKHVFVRESHSSMVHNGIIRAPVGSQIMLDAYTRAAVADKATMHWGQTGSRLLTKLADKHHAIRVALQPAAVFCPVAWSVIPITLREARIPGFVKAAYGMHLFHEMWRRNQFDPDMDTPIYQQLKEMVTCKKS